MGSYATTTSFGELIPGFLKGNTTTADTVGAAIISRHIDRAEGLVNSYLVGRYSLPFSTVPPFIRKLSEDIAVYNAMRGSYPQDGQLRQDYLDDFQTAIQRLEEIRDGKTKLADTSGSLIPALTTSRFLSNTRNYTPITGQDSAQKWKRDPDEVTDQDDARA